MREQDNASRGDDTYRKGLTAEIKAMEPLQRLIFFATVDEVTEAQIGATIHMALVDGATSRDVRKALCWPHEQVRTDWLLWVEDLADAGGLPPMEDLTQAALRLLAERELYGILTRARRDLPGQMREEAEARLELIEAWDRTAAERVEPFAAADEVQDAAAN